MYAINVCDINIYSPITLWEDNGGVKYIIVSSTHALTHETWIWGRVTNLQNPICDADPKNSTLTLTLKGKG